MHLFKETWLLIYMVKSTGEAQKLEVTARLEGIAIHPENSPEKLRIFLDTVEAATGERFTYPFAWDVPLSHLMKLGDSLGCTGEDLHGLLINQSPYAAAVHNLLNKEGLPDGKYRVFTFEATFKGAENPHLEAAISAFNGVRNGRVLDGEPISLRYNIDRRVSSVS
jgi:hypothetical protein